MTLNSVGRLYGVGVGPGDPELMTLKAQRIIASSDVIAYFAARARRGNSYDVIESLLTEHHEVIRFTYPVTTEAVAHADYEAMIASFYDECAATLAGHLTAGVDVAVICEGDPFFYGSYMYIHQRLATRFATEVVPGVTSFSAAAAAAGCPLVALNETLSVISGVLGPDELRHALAGADAAVIMKVGRNLAAVRDAVQDSGRANGAFYVERASHASERIIPLLETNDVDAPYFSLVLVPGIQVATR